MFVFLDFDGVLNTTKTSPEPQHRLVLDPPRLERLATLMDRSGANVVVSSNWRKGYGLPSIRSGFRRVGFPYADRFVDITPNLYDQAPRGHEIALWLLDRAPRRPFVILDDRSDMHPCQKHLVQTDPRYGLTDEHVSRALTVLSKRGGIK